MRTSSFEHIVRLQFNSLMMIVIKGTLSSHRRQIARRSKHEILFCELLLNSYQLLVQHCQNNNE